MIIFRPHGKKRDLRGDLSESKNDSQMIQRGQQSKWIERLFDERCFEANEPGRREDDTGLDFAFVRVRSARGDQFGRERAARISLNLGVKF